MSLKWHISEALEMTKVHHQNRHVHEVSQLKRATVPRNRNIKCRIQSRSSVGEGQNLNPKNLVTSQKSTETNNICKKESEQCRNMIQEH